MKARVFDITHQHIIPLPPPGRNDLLIMMHGGKRCVFRRPVDLGCLLGTIDHDFVLTEDEKSEIIRAYCGKKGTTSGLATLTKIVGELVLVATVFLLVLLVIACCVPAIAKLNTGVPPLKKPQPVAQPGLLQ